MKHILKTVSLGLQPARHEVTATKLFNTFFLLFFTIIAKGCGTNTEKIALNATPYSITIIQSLILYDYIQMIWIKLLMHSYKLTSITVITDIKLAYNF